MAVIGGGMAALAAALDLSEGSWHDRFDSIVVYQRGHLLGGKGASVRGAHGRIEEHGLHVLLGYYHQTFAVMRRCYDELDRTRTDPTCPIRSWDDAMCPSATVGLMDQQPSLGWVPWVADFSKVPPGQGDAPTPDTWTVSDAVTRSVRLLSDFFSSLGPGAASPAARRASVSLSTSPSLGAGRATMSDTAIDALRATSLSALAGLLEVARRLETTSNAGLLRAAQRSVGALSAALRHSVAQDADLRRTYQLIDVVMANLTGIVSDGLLARKEGFAAIDDLDYREWLRKHGADDVTLESPLVRGSYDLVFGYEGGDSNRPRVSAGRALDLGTRMYFGYQGDIFQKMRAGMGEVVFAPLYQVLKRRGVEFRFFHRVDDVRLSLDGGRVAEIDVGLERVVSNPDGSYEPLVKVKGLPCWPSSPRADQLKVGAARGDAGRLTLRSGEDFDVVVLGLSIGMVPNVCPDVVARQPAWRAMVEHVGTTATQSMQLWLRESEHELGWRHNRQVTVSAFAKPFDTWAGMSHVLPMEDWPEEDQPGTVAYFCSALPLPPAGQDVDAVRSQLLERAAGFLERSSGGLWPAAVGEHGFRWELLCDGNGRGRAARGAAELAHQYLRANLDPSDLYVQSLPGSSRYRLRPGETGIDNMVIAGDWTDCDINAGCIEAATWSGRLAARAVIERAGSLTTASAAS